MQTAASKTTKLGCGAASHVIDTANALAFPHAPGAGLFRQLSDKVPSL
jgi:hypothetical protein